jgi:hypothetical protein
VSRALLRPGFLQPRRHLIAQTMTAIDARDTSIFSWRRCAAEAVPRYLTLVREFSVRTSLIGAIWLTRFKSPRRESIDDLGTRLGRSAEADVCQRRLLSAAMVTTVFQIWFSSSIEFFDDMRSILDAPDSS